jgi:Predicted N-acetylglucosamine kinase
MTHNRDKRLLAVDGGGTKTLLWVGDGEGRILAKVQGDSTNLKSRPWSDVAGELARLVLEGLGSSGSTAEQVDAVVLGLAGSDRLEDKSRVVAHMSSMLPESVISVHNDAITALAAGTFGEQGMVLISGTGSICCGFDPAAGTYVRAGGWGYVFGDEGSGFALGAAALRAVVRAFDGRAAGTSLTDKVLAKLELSKPEQLVTAIYEAPYMRAKVASLAPTVFEAAREGDGQGRAIVKEAVRELAELVAAAYARFSPERRRMPLVLSGGVFNDALFLKEFSNRSDIRSLPLDIRVLNVPPVTGSYYMAVRQAGLRLTSDMIRRIQLQGKTEGECNHDTFS